MNIVSWQGHLDTAVTDEAGYGDLELEREASVGSPYWYAVTAQWLQVLGRGGERLATSMVYLSSPARGGRTAFPQLGISVPANRGDLLIW